MSILQGLLLAGAAGVGFLLWQKSQAQKSACQQLCGTDSTCLAACGGGGALLDALGGLFHTGRPNAQVLKDDAANNDKLNGAIKVPNTKLDTSLVKGVTGSGDTPSGSLPYGLGGNAIEYESGCVPFWGAEGWDKCVNGTVDMWGAEHRLASESVDMTEGWRYVTTRPAGRTADDKPGAPVAQHDYHSVRQGSIDPKSPDPTTQGPIKNPDGTATWLVAGERLTCPHNHAPARVDENHFAYPPTCVPVETTGIQGTGVQTAYSGDCQSMIDAGFTWNVDHWERLRAGQTAADAKCPPGSSPSTGKALRPVMVSALL